MQNIKLIVSNWKMNPGSLDEAVLLAKKIDAGIPKKKNIEVVIAPPFPFLESIRYQVSGIKLGAQDAFWENGGAYTGEVSPTMLKRLGVEYVIVGHSERRTFLHETDEMINKKVLASLKAGLKVILCVGEPLEVRKQGIAAAKSFIKNQLKRDLKGIENCKLKIENLIIAYEPIWAISTSGAGKSDKPTDAAEMIQFIKYQVSSIKYQVSVLYGGSVTSQNVRSFVCYNGSASLTTSGIDGALVGGACLKAEEFKKIIQSIS